MWEWILKWWPIIAGLAAAVWAVGMLILSFIRRVRRVEERQAKLEGDVEGHEGECALRWQANKSAFDAHVAKMDERHVENRARLSRIEDKLDAALNPRARR